MAKSGIGFHILYEQLDHDAAKNKLIGYIQKVNPRWVNIMGGARRDQAFLFARQLREQFKDLKVVFRNWPDDGNNIKNEYRNNPQLWVDHNVEFLKAGLTVLTDNESVTDDMTHYARWSADIMNICGNHGWSVAVGRFAVGNVQGYGSDKNNQYAQMDTMWKALARWGKLHVWSPNEYFDPTGLHSEGLVGRYNTGLARSRQLGLPDPVVMIGEYGAVYRDNNGGLDADAGYKDSRCKLSGKQAAQLSIDLYKKHYQPNGVDVSLYAYGDSIGDRWSRFRIDNDDDFMNTIVRAAQAGELIPSETGVSVPPVVVTPPVVVPPVVAPPVGQTTPPNVPTTPTTPQKFILVTEGVKYRVAVPMVFVNMRKDANGAVVGSAYGGEIVRALDEKKDSSGVIWVKAETFTGASGWISSQSGKVTFTKV